MIHVILKNSNNSIALMQIMDSADIEETVKKFKDVNPDYTDHIVLNKKPIVPKSRIFRDAWSLNDKNKIEIDMDKAREIKLEHIRNLRNEKLKELDIDKIIAEERGYDSQHIVDLKQKLRDLPDTINLNLLKTPTKLEQFIPKELI